MQNFVYQQATTGCIKKLLTHSETRSRWRLMRASVMCSQYPWPWISCATAFIVSPIEDDAVDRLEDQPALHYRSQVRNAPDLPPSFGVWLLVLSSESEIVDTYRQSAMIWCFVLCICISRSQLSLYPNCSDAKFQITFIPTRLTVFECHFHNSYYYQIDISGANFNKIYSIFSEIQTFKDTPWAIKTCHFVFEYNSGFLEQFFLFLYRCKQEWVLYNLLTW